MNILNFNKTRKYFTKIFIIRMISKKSPYDKALLT